MERKRVYLCLAHMSGKEMDYIKEAFDTNWVVPLGPNVNGFEKDLEEFVGEGKRVVALSSGTSAVHLSLIACGVGAGDEVMVQSFTFCASSNPVKYLGATPVFVDSERDTWNMDPQLLRFSCFCLTHLSIDVLYPLSLALVNKKRIASSGSVGVRLSSHK